MFPIRSYPRAVLSAIVFTAALLGTACSNEATGPSQSGGASDRSPSTQSDSTRPSFGYRVGP
jgi:hypothetical protein